MLEAERFDTRYKFGNTFFENHQFGIFLLGRGDIGFGFLKIGIGILTKNQYRVTESLLPKRNFGSPIARRRSERRFSFGSSSGRVL